MTYIDEIAGALVRVLTHACDGPPHRFAGYAANADFWTAEARHCLDVIAGYEERFRKMRAATVEQFSPGGSEEEHGSALTTRTTKHSDRAAARRQVTDAVRRFLKRCDKTQALDQDVLIALCERAGVQYPP